MRRAAVVLALGILVPWACSSSKDVILVPEHDREMDAAIQQARSEVSTFVERLQKPLSEDESFSVKAPLRDGETVEHFWLNDVRWEQGVFHGTLGNDPELVKGHKYGEPVAVPDTEISDWMYAHKGVLVGGYSFRLLRKRMPASERERLDKEMTFRVE